jgi:hypothetical protein
VIIAGVATRDEGAVGLAQVWDGVVREALPLRGPTTLPRRRPGASAALPLNE